jgi:hypothetical protein
MSGDESKDSHSSDITHLISSVDGGVPPPADDADKRRQTVSDSLRSVDDEDDDFDVAKSAPEVGIDGGKQNITTDEDDDDDDDDDDDETGAADGFAQLIQQSIDAPGSAVDSPSIVISSAGAHGAMGAGSAAGIGVSGAGDRDEANDDDAAADDAADADDDDDDGGGDDNEDDEDNDDNGHHARGDEDGDDAAAGIQQLLSQIGLAVGSDMPNKEQLIAALMESGMPAELAQMLNSELASQSGGAGSASTAAAPTVTVAPMSGAAAAALAASATSRPTATPRSLSPTLAALFNSRSVDDWVRYDHAPPISIFVRGTGREVDDVLSQFIEANANARPLSYTPYADGVGFGFRIEIVQSEDMPASLRAHFGRLIAAKNAELRQVGVVGCCALLDDSIDHTFAFS